MGLPKSIKEWREKHQISYRWAKECGKLEELALAMGLKYKSIKSMGTWQDIENIKDLLREKQFKTLSEWTKSHGGSYQSARKLGFLPQLRTEFFPDAQVTSGTWQDIENIKKILREKQFKNIKAWQKSRSGSYKGAQKAGFLPQLRAEFFSDAQAQAPRGTWQDIENIKEILRKHQFKTLNEWQKSHQSSYGGAQKADFLPQLRAEFFPNTKGRGSK